MVSILKIRLQASFTLNCANGDNLIFLPVCSLRLETLKLLLLGLRLKLGLLNREL